MTSHDGIMTSHDRRSIHLKLHNRVQVDDLQEPKLRHEPCLY
jgi:hypothetical protein